MNARLHSAVIALCSLLLAAGAFAQTAPQLRADLLTRATTPVLDAAIIRVAGSDHDSLLMLHPESVELWDGPVGSPLARSVAIPPTRVNVRDLRGRLAVRRWPNFDVYLPGQTCNGSFSPQLTLACEGNTDPWPLGASLLEQDDLDARFPFTRNFFSGEVQDARDNFKLPPFYAAAHWRGTTPADKRFWLLTGADGRVYRFASGEAKEFAATGWGSDITTIQAECGQWLLVTGTGDWAQPDTVRALTLDANTAKEAAPALPLPGPATALWPEGAGKAAMAVVRNLQNGAYEVYRLEAVCGR